MVNSVCELLAELLNGIENDQIKSNYSPVEIREVLHNMQDRNGHIPESDLVVYCYSKGYYFKKISHYSPCTGMPYTPLIILEPICPGKGFATINININSHNFWSSNENGEICCTSVDTIPMIYKILDYYLYGGAELERSNEVEVIKDTVKDEIKEKYNIEEKDDLDEEN